MAWAIIKPRSLEYVVCSLPGDPRGALDTDLKVKSFLFLIQGTSSMLSSTGKRFIFLSGRGLTWVYCDCFEKAVLISQRWLLLLLFQTTRPPTWHHCPQNWRTSLHKVPWMMEETSPPLNLLYVQMSSSKTFSWMSRVTENLDIVKHKCIANVYLRFSLLPFPLYVLCFVQFLFVRNGCQCWNRHFLFYLQSLIHLIM